MGRNDRTVLILGLLAVVLLVVGYYFLLLNPLLNRLDERVQERSEKEVQLANLRQEVAQLEAARANAPELERQLLELSKRIPEEPEIPTLLVQIEEIAGASGVTQLSIAPGTPAPPPGGGNFSVLPITMRFEGTYEQLQDFLLRTRNLTRLVTANDVTYCRVPPLDPEAACPIDVEVAGAEEEATAAEVEALLRVEIQAEVYFQPQDVPAGVAPVPPTVPETPRGTAEEPPAEATDAE